MDYLCWFCNEEGLAGTFGAMVLKLRRLRQGYSRSPKASGEHGHLLDSWEGNTDVGSANLYYRGSYFRAERLCESGSRCSVSTFGHQCVAHATASRHVPTV